MRIVVVGVWPVIENVDGSEKFSGNDKQVSDVISIGWFTRFGSASENVCGIQCESLCDEVGGLEGFSRTCLEVGVEPK